MTFWIFLLSIVTSQRVQYSASLLPVAILLFFTIAFMLHSQRFSHPMSFLVLSVSHCVVLLFVPITDDDETLTQVSALNEGKSKRKSTTKSKKTLGGNGAVCLVGNDWELFFYTNIKLTYSKDLIWIEIKTENRWLVMPNSFGYDFTALVGVDNSLWLTTVIISHGNNCCWVLSDWQTALLWCVLLACTTMICLTWENSVVLLSFYIHLLTSNIKHCVNIPCWSFVRSLKSSDIKQTATSMIWLSNQST